MTYHYGPATWFLTMSPSKWNWDDLALFITEVNSSVKDITKKSASELMAFDPVSASRFIDNKFRGMLDFILSEDAPLGKVIHEGNIKIEACSIFICFCGLKMLRC